MNLHPHLLWALAGIGGLLVLATLIVAVLSRKNPDKDYGELRARVNTWWIMAGVFDPIPRRSRT